MVSLGATVVAWGSVEADRVSIEPFCRAFVHDDVHAYDDVHVGPRAQPTLAPTLSRRDDVASPPITMRSSLRKGHVLFSLCLFLLWSACSDDEGGGQAAGGDATDRADAGGDLAADQTGDGDADADAVDASSDGESDLQPDGPPPPPDRDDDGVPDTDDLFPDDPCEATDMDGDGIGDASDPDRDGDEVIDRWERRVGTDPNDPADHPDDTDSDGDEVPDYRDPFPFDGERFEDLDGDGLADEEDPDDDNDLISDEEEAELGTDPRGLIPREICALGHGPDWYPGDFHSHTTYSDGTEDLDDWIAVHEYYEDPRFLAVHPEYEGRGLRFQAITDHRTAAGPYDPEFHSDRLLLISGEEVGGPGHGNALDILSRIDHLPWADERYDAIMARALHQAHWHGGTYQANHPTNPDIAWTTPTSELDAIEVWNALWGAIQAMTEADLDREGAGRGEENPFIRPAVRQVTTNANDQALRLWELMMTAGIEIAPVGGSDRHTLLAPGSPTTWVWARRLTAHDIGDAVRERHTVITRNPGALRLEATLEGDEPGRLHLVGDEVELTAGATATLSLHVEHGAGCAIQVVAAPLLAEPTREALLEAPAAELLVTHVIPDEAADPYDWTVEVEPPVPGWMYVRMIEPIKLDHLSEESQQLVQNALDTMRAGINDPVDMAPALIPLIYGPEFLGSIPCEEANWTRAEELNAECFLVDQKPPYTFLLPEEVDRVLNYWSGTAPDGDWAMGAITSAFHLREP
jgi:hypothetical protein